MDKREVRAVVIYKVFPFKGNDTERHFDDRKETLRQSVITWRAEFKRGDLPLMT